VFETVEILRRARKCEVRLFCLGIGSAGQDRFLQLLARQTGGVCRFVMPSEQVDFAAEEVFAGVGGAVASEVRIRNANAQPASASTVFAGTPFVAFGSIDEDAAAAELEWQQGSTHVPFETLGEDLLGFLEKLQGAKLIADFEARYERSDAAARQRLLELSERYGLASSEMSLVAEVERADDQAGNAPKTKILPVGMPQDTRFGAYFDDEGLDCLMSKGPVAALFSLATEPRLSAGGGVIWESMTQPSTANDLLSILREAIGIVDDRASLHTGPDANQRLAEALSQLVTHDKDAVTDTQKAALAAFIDFLSSEMIDFLNTGGLDIAKWRAIGHQLEQAWPELTNIDSGKGSANEIDEAAEPSSARRR
ncbi:MAG: hypothetical protein WB676_18250, partial [Bryobacteraceae bacterium]